MDCPGDEIQNLKPKTKLECKSSCDSDAACTFAAYGGAGGPSGTPTDWWANRCVLRKNKGQCSSSEWMDTYIKQGE